jgi:hypothetical protein
MAKSDIVISSDAMSPSPLCIERSWDYKRITALSRSCCCVCCSSNRNEAEGGQQLERAGNRRYKNISSLNGRSTFYNAAGNAILL